MSLHLNVSKCQVIAHPYTITADQQLFDFQRIDISEALLLGAPLFRGFTLDEAWAKRCNELRVAVDRLSLLAAQDALVLLRSSFSAPRVQHLLRCSPSADHPGLQIYDRMLRHALSDITNSDLTDLQWLQASLPIKHGGLGVRMVSSLALPAFLSSAMSTSDLQSSCLSRFSHQPDAVFTELVTPLPTYPFHAAISCLSHPSRRCWMSSCRKSVHVNLPSNTFRVPLDHLVPLI